ncbi:MAG: hypothetical protein M5U28_45950 [Sandaracinaceae bacterium]|nr:hypothetical protein [Sandaracinaceae bacterium]
MMMSRPSPSAVPTDSPSMNTSAPGTFTEMRTLPIWGAPESCDM